jgi:hypothetical protein
MDKEFAFVPTGKLLHIEQLDVSSCSVLKECQEKWYFYSKVLYQWSTRGRDTSVLA